MNVCIDAHVQGLLWVSGRTSKVIFSPISVVLFPLPTTVTSIVTNCFRCRIFWEDGMNLLPSSTKLKQGSFLIICKIWDHLHGSELRSGSFFFLLCSCELQHRPIVNSTISAEIEWMLPFQDLQYRTPTRPRSWKARLLQLEIQQLSYSSYWVTSDGRPTMFKLALEFDVLSMWYYEI